MLAKVKYQAIEAVWGCVGIELVPEVEDLS